MDGNCPGWELSGMGIDRWELSGMGNVRDGNCPMGIVRDGNCPGWELPGMGIARDGNCPPGGNCPGIQLNDSTSIFRAFFDICSGFMIRETFLSKSHKKDVIFYKYSLRWCE